MGREKQNQVKCRIPKRIRQFLILLIWLLLWQLLAELIHNRILFVRPAEAFAALFFAVADGRVLADCAAFLFSYLQRVFACFFAGGAVWHSGL